eukprot:13363196-Ditylum_brightwellii.AAC.1
MPKNFVQAVTSEMVLFKSNFVSRSGAAGDDFSSAYSRLLVLGNGDYDITLGTSALDIDVDCQ